MQSQGGAVAASGPISQPSAELQPRFPSQPSGIAALLSGVKQEQTSPDKEAAAASSMPKQEDGQSLPKLEGGADSLKTEQPPATLAERHAGLPEDIKSLLLEHAAFLQTSGVNNNYDDNNNPNHNNSNIPIPQVGVGASFPRMPVAPQLLSC